MRYQIIGEILMAFGIAILISNLFRANNWSQVYDMFLNDPDKIYIEGFKSPPRNLKLEVIVKGGSIDLYLVDRRGIEDLEFSGLNIKLKNKNISYIKYYHNITYLCDVLSMERKCYFILVKILKMKENNVIVNIRITLYGFDRDLIYIGLSLILIGISLIIVAKRFDKMMIKIF